MTRFKDEEATADLAIVDRAFRKDKLVVKLDHGGWLLVLTGNERGDSTAIAVRVCGKPRGPVVIAAANPDRIADLQPMQRHGYILAWTRSRAPACSRLSGRHLDLSAAPSADLDLREAVRLERREDLAVAEGLAW